MQFAAFAIDQLYLIAVTIFALASFAIVSWSRRRRPHSSGRVGLAGLRTAALASIVPVAILAILAFLVILWLRLVLDPLYWSTYPHSVPPTVDPASQAWDNVIGLLTLMSIPGVTFLAVLDLYAIRPPSTENEAGDAESYTVLGSLLSLFLLGGNLLVQTQIDEAARRDAQVAVEAERDAEARALEARSAGLSIVVTDVDADLGSPTDEGRLVSRLVLDVTLRSTTAIELNQTGEDVDARMFLFSSPRGAWYGEISAGMELPARIPAGFETTYHLDVPTAWSCPNERHVFVPEPCATTSDGVYLGHRDFNPALTGPWKATIEFSNAVSFDDPRRLNYKAETAFTVGEAP